MQLGRSRVVVRRVVGVAELRTHTARWGRRFDAAGAFACRPRARMGCNLTLTGCRRALSQSLARSREGEARDAIRLLRILDQLAHGLVHVRRVLLEGSL